MKTILASASPRRRELLGQIGIEFEVKVSNVEEAVTAVEPGKVVEELSRQKAEAVLAALEEGREGAPAVGGDTVVALEEGREGAPAVGGDTVAALEEGREGAPAVGGDTVVALEEGREGVLIVGADTVVAMEGRILGKPSDPEDAAEMLRGLAGNVHEVYTGVALLYRSGDTVQRKVFHERTKVEVFPMTEEEIQRYVRSGECMDKAGAYGIQGFFARYVSRIEGDYNNVVGLPVGRLYQEAKEWLES